MRLPFVRQTAAILAPLLLATAAAAQSEGAPADGDTRPVLSRSDSVASARTRAAADRARGRRLLVSLADRRLWLVDGGDTLRAATVAVGRGDTLSHGRVQWKFDTPRGMRPVLRRERNPVWVPPLWHFVRRARETGRTLVELAPGRPHRFPDGSLVRVRGGTVGHLLPNGAWFPFEPGQEVVVNGHLFVPPLGTTNRRVAGELGAFKLDLGDGYLIHGTPHKDSLGQAATHGCIRVGDEDLAYLFRNVPPGTPVYIF